MSTIMGGDDEPQLRAALPIATGRRAVAKLWHQVLRFRTRTKPDDPEIVAAIEANLPR